MPPRRFLGPSFGMGSALVIFDGGGAARRSMCRSILSRSSSPYAPVYHTHTTWALSAHTHTHLGPDGDIGGRTVAPLPLEVHARGEAALGADGALHLELVLGRRRLHELGLEDEAGVPPLGGGGEAGGDFALGAEEL